MEGLGVDSKHILSREVTLRPFQSYLSMLESGFWEVMLRISAQRANHELLYHCSNKQLTQQQRREGQALCPLHVHSSFSPMPLCSLSQPL